jgi:hypothetical protein
MAKPEGGFADMEETNNVSIEGWLSSLDASP